MCICVCVCVLLSVHIFEWIFPISKDDNLSISTEPICSVKINFHREHFQRAQTIVWSIVKKKKNMRAYYWPFLFL